MGKEEGIHIPEKPGSFWAQCLAQSFSLLVFVPGLPRGSGTRSGFLARASVPMQMVRPVSKLDLSLRLPSEPQPLSLLSVAQFSVLCPSLECQVSLLIYLFLSYCQSVSLFVCQSASPWDPGSVHWSVPWIMGQVVS